MADSADLVVLGAYYGTGAKGGMMSVFLMGVWDEQQGVWKTVCKCGNGHDDAKLLELQDELTGNMQKIGRDYDKVPAWLDVNRGLVPDLVVRDPQESVVWEVAGAEYVAPSHFH
jgi:DNA ligase-3